MDCKPTELSRRELLQGLGPAAGFLIVKPQAVRGSQANSVVTFGLIGSSNRGSYVASIAHRHPRGRVTALCDLFDDQIERAKQRIQVEQPAVFKDFEKLLASDVDAVIIATPPADHPKMLEAAVDARKHIYCEKPAGVDVEGCKRVIQASRRHDPSKCLTFGFQQRYGPVYLEAYRRLTSGQIGELVNARGFWIASDPFKLREVADPKEYRIRNWFAFRDLSGDFIVEQDCHNFDVLHWFLNALPLRVVGYGGRKVRTNMEILDHLSLSFEWPDGIHVNYEANQITPRGWRRIGEEFTGTTGVLETSRAQMVHTKADGEKETIASQRDITIDAVEAFIDKILTGNVENTGERSALSTLIAIMGRTAIYERREVEWKEIYEG